MKNIPLPFNGQSSPGFRGWYSLLTFCWCCLAFFVRIYILLGFVILAVLYEYFKELQHIVYAKVHKPVKPGLPPSLDDYIPLRDADDEEEKKCMEEEEYFKWKHMLDDDEDDDKEEDKKK